MHPVDGLLRPQPAVFVCENNLYGMGTSAERSSSNTKYYTRGDLIPGLQVNGMDVLSVYGGVKFAKEWTQSGKGPLLLEFVTYRYGGHSMSDPGTTYRTREEIQHMRSANDPITGLKQRLLDWGIISEDELKAIDKSVRQEVDADVEEAKKSPEPEMDSLATSSKTHGSSHALFADVMLRSLLRGYWHALPPRTRGTGGETALSLG